jgi:hypothetical protein
LQRMLGTFSLTFTGFCVSHRLSYRAEIGFKVRKLTMQERQKR